MDRVLGPAVLRGAGELEVGRGRWGSPTALHHSMGLGLCCRFSAEHHSPHPAAGLGQRRAYRGAKADSSRLVDVDPADRGGQSSAECLDSADFGCKHRVSRSHETRPGRPLVGGRDREPVRASLTHISM